MTLTVPTPADLAAHVGDALGPTDWVTITQERIDQFAEATGDHEGESAEGTSRGGVGGWIHVDPERAAAGPFGAPIAHGYLTLSLANLFLPELLVVEQFSMGVNVGVEKVRFPNPVRVGSRIRGLGEIVSVTEVGEGVQAVVRITIEIEGEAKPACVVDTVSRFFP